MEFKKKHFQANGLNFIKYQGKPGMIITVWDFDDHQSLFEAIEKKSKILYEVGLPFYKSTTKFNDKHFLLVATEFIDDVPENNEITFNTMKRIMRYLAEWYFYVVLQPEPDLFSTE